MKLSTPEHFRWLVLRWVNVGEVAWSGNGWLRHGRPPGPFLAEFFGMFQEEGLVDVGDPSPRDGVSPVTLTDAGRARYSELCRKQRRPTVPGTGTR